MKSVERDDCEIRFVRMKGTGIFSVMKVMLSSILCFLVSAFFSYLGKDFCNSFFFAILDSVNYTFVAACIIHAKLVSLIELKTLMRAFLLQKIFRKI